MLKRYEIKDVGDGELMNLKNENGEWVKYEDVEKLIKKFEKELKMDIELYEKHLKVLEQESKSGEYNKKWELRPIDIHKVVDKEKISTTKFILKSFQKLMK